MAEPGSAANTPMFHQFRELKAANPDAILFFRMGDFYETFFEDAVIAARELELTLTSRNSSDPTPIPMAGVPYHAVTPYLQRLVEAGYRVAIAEQIEDPKLAKGLVKRAVVRVVTPGVAFDPTAGDAREATRLVAIAPGVDQLGVAFLDVSTGDLRVARVADDAAAAAEIYRLEPREALFAPDLDLPLCREALRRVRAVTSRSDAGWWRPEAAFALVRDTVSDAVPEGAEIVAAGVLVAYGQKTTGGPLRNVHAVRPYAPGAYVVIDDTTRRNLEIARTVMGERKKGSLLGLVDLTCTAMGGRRLREWFAFPLLDVARIDQRQDAVAALIDESPAREGLTASLREVADIERIGARVGQGTATPRELGLLRRSLAAVPGVLGPVAPLHALRAFLPDDVCADVLQDLQHWLVDDPPLTSGDGGLIRPGADPILEDLVRRAAGGLGAIRDLEKREQDATGITSLKIRSTGPQGWYIEITRANLHKVPSHYVRRQTLTNNERYIIPELKEIEEDLATAQERQRRLEAERFTELRERTASASARLLALARRLADLDVLCALAEVAVRYRFVRPTLDETLSLEIVAGRHPVVEASLTDERFVPNDVVLDADARRLIVLTGPNMAGKSTVLRQTAIIALLAQVGSHVPADRVRLGVVDRIFTRVGASDDLASGRSTFMVEMAETAAILKHATRRSLVLLDEIGRGTSTYDGLAIAWAVAEDLARRVSCRAMFATHYHELCELAEQIEGIANQSVAVHDTGDRVVFLRTLREGGASRSYGIQCARLAGLPAPVVERARALLTKFERHAPRNERHQLSLFGAIPPGEVPAPPVQEDPVRDLLRATDPDGLTPKQAHEALYALRRLL